MNPETNRVQKMDILFVLEISKVDTLFDTLCTDIKITSEKKVKKISLYSKLREISISLPSKKSPMKVQDMIHLEKAKLQCSWLAVCKKLTKAFQRSTTHPSSSRSWETVRCCTQTHFTMGAFTFYIDKFLGFSNHFLPHLSVDSLFNEAYVLI